MGAGEGAREEGEKRERNDEDGESRRYWICIHNATRLALCGDAGGDR